MGGVPTEQRAERRRRRTDNLAAPYWDSSALESPFERVIPRMYEKQTLVTWHAKTKVIRDKSRNRAEFTDHLAVEQHVLEMKNLSALRPVFSFEVSFVQRKAMFQAWVRHPIVDRLFAANPVFDPRCQ
jgi:hypothetical protein